MGGGVNGCGLLQLWLGCLYILMALCLFIRKQGFSSRLDCKKVTKIVDRFNDSVLKIHLWLPSEEPAG